MLTSSVGPRSLLQIAAFGFAAVPLLAGTAAAQLTDAPISEPVQRLNSALWGRDVSLSHVAHIGLT